MTNFTTEFCRTHLFVGLRMGVDAPDVWAAHRRSITTNSSYPNTNPQTYLKLGRDMEPFGVEIKGNICRRH